MPWFRDLSDTRSLRFCHFCISTWVCMLSENRHSTVQMISSSTRDTDCCKITCQWVRTACVLVLGIVHPSARSSGS